MASNLGARRLSPASVKALTAAGFSIIGSAATRNDERIFRANDGRWGYSTINGQPVYSLTLASALALTDTITETAEVCTICGYLDSSIGHKNSH